MKVYVCARFTHNDIHLFEHFMNYYLELGVHKFLINFNYKIEGEESLFENFIEYVNNSKYINTIIYNVGPNFECLNESSNINVLKKLVIDNTNIEEDYIIPADSDEFQEFPDTLENTVQLMEKEDLIYLDGCTRERVSETGEAILIEKNINIFEQFPKYNNFLFCHPKIGMIKASHFNHIGVGHHYYNINRNLEEDKINVLKHKRISITNHFRWDLQGKNRIKSWLKIWNDENYKAWKDIKKYEKMLTAFDTNLLDYK